MEYIPDAKDCYCHCDFHTLISGRYFLCFGSMVDDHHRAGIAGKILADREARYALFPSEIFDEYAWNMLLHLFVALNNGRDVSESALIRLVHTSTNTGQRWLYQLDKDGQVENRHAGDDVKLTAKAKTRLRQYLDTIETP